MTDQLGPLPEIESPLANLDQAIPEIIYGNGPEQHVIGDAVVGAVIGGLAGAWLGRRAARRAQRVQELKESLGIAEVQ